jgi:hypothetical protein
MLHFYDQMYIVYKNMQRCNIQIDAYESKYSPWQRATRTWYATDEVRYAHDRAEVTATLRRGAKYISSDLHPRVLAELGELFELIVETPGCFRLVPIESH